MALLSGVAAAVHHHHQPPPAALSTASPGAALTLSGTERGVFFAHQSSSGRTYDLTGTGRLTPLGLTALTGNLHVVSGISSGPPNGTLLLAASHGTVKLQIPRSVVIPAGLPTPTSTNEIVDTYTISSGTGAYKGDTGAGVVEFTFHPVTSAGASFQVGQVSISFGPLPAASSPPTSSS
jgi:hypothetical protein